MTLPRAAVPGAAAAAAVLTGALALGAPPEEPGEGRTLALSPPDHVGLDLPSLAGDGRRVAYLHGGNIFLHDRRDGNERLVSLSSAGIPADRQSGWPSASHNGRFVAFTSFATNLGALEPAHAPHLFVRDLRTDTTLAIGHPRRQRRGNEWPSLPLLSGDGGTLAWITRASNLVPGDRNGALDVYVYDLRRWRTSRVSVATSGAEADADSATFSLSRDGRYVAFASHAANLAEADDNGAMDVFVRDRARRETVWISRPPGGGAADGHSDYPAISADGRFVAFASDAANLVADDGNGARDIFVHDRATGSTRRVSVSSRGEQANAGSDFPAISGDGRFVAFASQASNLVQGDENTAGDVFLRDRRAGVTLRVSVADDGSEADEESGLNEVEISVDGRCVLFDSLASNLTPGTPSTQPGFFVRELRKPRWRRDRAAPARGVPKPGM